MEKVAVIEVLEYNGAPVSFDLAGETLWANVSGIARKHGKKPSHYLDQKRTKELIQAVQGKSGIPDLVQIRHGGENPGTWLHKSLLLDFARWVSPDFAVWMDQQVAALIAKRAPAPAPGLAMLEMVHQLAAGTIAQFKAQQVEIETIKADVATIKAKQEAKAEDWGIAPPKEKSHRAQVNEIVRAHAFVSKTYKDDWDRLFREFRYRYGIDAERRADNSPNMDKLDIIEDLGQMKELRDLAIHLFGKPASWREQA